MQQPSSAHPAYRHQRNPLFGVSACNSISCCMGTTFGPLVINSSQHTSKLFTTTFLAIYSQCNLFTFEYLSGTFFREDVGQVDTAKKRALPIYTTGDKSCCLLRIFFSGKKSSHILDPLLTCASLITYACAV